MRCSKRGTGGREAASRRVPGARCEGPRCFVPGAWSTMPGARVLSVVAAEVRRATVPAIALSGRPGGRGRWGACPWATARVLGLRARCPGAGCDRRRGATGDGGCDRAFGATDGVAVARAVCTDEAVVSVLVTPRGAPLR